MKLKPEHLQHFPFYEDQKIPGLLIQLNESIIFPANKKNLNYIVEHQLKPLLRQLSELKNKILLEKIPITLRSEIIEIIENKKKVLKNSTKQLLLKNLFDVDGLIELGLALPYHFELKDDPKSIWAFD